MAAGILGVFLGYWLLHAADALILKTHESGDLATWFAASGTILTLGFLINQHTQLRAEQKKENEERKVEESKQRKELAEESKKREEHEKKQQKMWAQQNEMLTFQKYEAHFELFNKLLDRIETEERFRGIYVFPERTRTYAALFPNNNLSHCEFDFSSQTENHNSLQTIESIMADVVKYATVLSTEKVDKKDALLKFTACLNLWANTLGSRLKENDIPGSYGVGTIAAYRFFNISRGLSCILALCDITDELRRFANIQPLTQDSRDAFCIFMKEDLYINLFLLTGENTIYNTNLGALNSLAIFSKVYQIGNDAHLRIQDSIVDGIPRFFPDVSTDVLEKLSNRDYVIQKYVTTIDKLQAVLPKLEGNNKKPIEQLVLELKKQLETD
ncbi:hypothetical protein [Vibrio sp. 10N.222.55.C7]|uniref:hypothetical protein n=1 Tax=Vibrio sp. 10N.222.55.C7 TaxID=3229650 RepID=UPI0035504790